MKKLVQKFLENRCSPEESAKVLRWLQTEEGEAYLKEYFSEDADLFFEMSDPGFYPELDSSQLFEEIKEINNGKYLDERSLSETEKEKFTGSQIQQRSITSHPIRRFLFMAAAAACLIVAVITYNLQREEHLPEDFTAIQVVSTERGERRTIRLNDGSEVILNHESTLRIPGDFSGANRQLVLEGEAWFEVVPHPSHPFVVTGSNSVIKVLGTSFAVESYPGEGKTRVVVEEGKVVLGSQNAEDEKGKTIEKNQTGILRNGGEVELKDIPNTALYTAWKDGKLIFQNTPFKDVITRLERWYDIDCNMTEPSLGEERLTSAFGEEPLLQVLDVIALSMNITYEIENRTVTFKPDNS